MPHHIDTRLTVPINSQRVVVRHTCGRCVARHRVLLLVGGDAGGLALAAPGPVQGLRQTPRAACCDSLVLVLVHRGPAIEGQVDQIHVQHRQVAFGRLNIAVVFLEAFDVGLHERSLTR